MQKINPIPEGYHTINPYIMTDNVEELFSFLESAFGAISCSKTTSANGSILNLEVKVGTSMLMLATARGGFGPMPMSFYLYVENVDEIYKRAIQAGGESLNEPDDRFYGNRDCGVKGPKGNFWFIASRIEVLTEEEITKRITPKTRTK